MYEDTLCSDAKYNKLQKITTLLHFALVNFSQIAKHNNFVTFCVSQFFTKRKGTIFHTSDAKYNKNFKVAKCGKYSPKLMFMSSLPLYLSIFTPMFVPATGKYALVCYLAI